MYNYEKMHWVYDNNKKQSVIYDERHIYTDVTHTCIKHLQKNYVLLSSIY